MLLVVQLNIIQLFAQLVVVKQRLDLNQKVTDLYIAALALKKSRANRLNNL
jgi:hypothetical protein